VAKSVKAGVARIWHRIQKLGEVPAEALKDAKKPVRSGKSKKQQAAAKSRSGQRTSIGKTKKSYFHRGLSRNGAKRDK
jgi:hypothetical protein